MKRYWLTGIALTVFMSLQAQQQSGKITYSRTVELRISFAGMGDMQARDIPKTHTDKFEVSFGNNQSLKKAVVDEQPEPTGFDNGGRVVMVRSFGGGSDDVVYFNYGEKRSVDQREFAGKKYVIADSVRQLEWKIPGESKTILGLPCQKAVAQKIGKRVSNMMINGEMKQTEVADTSNIVAWFTPAIPVPTGPEYQGQLPGAILEISVNDGKTVYQALEISEKVDLAAIKEPKSGKKVTMQQFTEEQKKLMQDMQRTNGGRGQTIRVN
ncbi:MAG: GLPGLI family protein [Chitinophagaceae bacterium]|nr:MAG: GLPGLI family protein [Chitinophagaceae bacterium]